MNVNDAQTITDQIDRAYERISNEDRAEWRNNPCTQWLIKALQGDALLMYAMWVNNGFRDGDPLTPDQAVGKAQAINDIHESIEEMLNGGEDSVDPTGGSQDPG